MLNAINQFCMGLCFGSVCISGLTLISFVWFEDFESFKYAGRILVTAIIIGITSGLGALITKLLAI